MLSSSTANEQYTCNFPRINENPSHQVINLDCSGFDIHTYYKKYGLANFQPGTCYLPTEESFGDTPTLCFSSKSTPLEDPVTPNTNSTGITFHQNSDFLITPNLLSHRTSAGQLFSELVSEDIARSMNGNNCQVQSYSSIDKFYRKFLKLDDFYLQTSESDPKSPSPENLLLGYCNSNQYAKCVELPDPAIVDHFGLEANDTDILGLDAQIFHSSPQNQCTSEYLLAYPTVDYISTPSSLGSTFDYTNTRSNTYFDSLLMPVQNDSAYQNQNQNLNSCYAHHSDNMEYNPLKPYDAATYCKNMLEHPTFSNGNGSLKTIIENTHIKTKKCNPEAKHKKNKRVKCPLCPMIITKKNLSAHRATVHDKNKTRHKCPYPNCSKSYSRKNDLEDRHINPFHRGLNYRCKICSRSFTRKDKLTRHVQDSHKNTN